MQSGFRLRFLKHLYPPAPAQAHTSSRLQTHVMQVKGPAAGLDRFLLLRTLTATAFVPVG